MKQALIFLIFFLMCSGIFGQMNTSYILLISFDGFRAEYLDWYSTPNFDSIARKGVKAKSLKPVFLSKTFIDYYYG